MPLRFHTTISRRSSGTMMTTSRTILRLMRTIVTMSPAVIAATLCPLVSPSPTCWVLVHEPRPRMDRSQSQATGTHALAVTMLTRLPTDVLWPLVCRSHPCLALPAAQAPPWAWFPLESTPTRLPHPTQPHPQFRTLADLVAVALGSVAAMVMVIPP